MKASVIIFPGTNREHDVADVLESVSGRKPQFVWHSETQVPPTDLIVLPGGFSYGDYLRCGAMAARSPIMRDVIAKAKAGTPVLGICNGFQILCESGLLPGVLMRNASLKFVCKEVWLRIEQPDTIFTSRFKRGEVMPAIAAHAEGNYFADADTLDRLESEGRVVFRYADPQGNVTPEANPNGSQRSIAGICDERRRVLGLMPHPENASDPLLGPTGGRRLFESLVDNLVGAA
jgi:phosphoribosylformylglycinamidine synthase|nr:MAG: phosphoribosylformylglycinamidine synthase subunit PurQ [Pseudomonadota bacterium]